MKVTTVVLILYSADPAETMASQSTYHVQYKQIYGDLSKGLDSSLNINLKRSNRGRCKVPQMLLHHTKSPGNRNPNPSETQNPSLYLTFAVATQSTSIWLLSTFAALLHSTALSVDYYFHHHHY